MAYRVYFDKLLCQNRNGVHPGEKKNNTYQAITYICCNPGLIMGVTASYVVTIQLLTCTWINFLSPVHSVPMYKTPCKYYLIALFQNRLTKFAMAKQKLNCLNQTSKLPQ